VKLQNKIMLIYLIKIKGYNYKLNIYVCIKSNLIAYKKGLIIKKENTTKDKIKRKYKGKDLKIK